MPSRKPRPPLHIHLHVDPDIDTAFSEVHLHLHASRQTTCFAAGGGVIEAEAITLPAVGAEWLVRPDGVMSSPYGFICLYGLSEVVDRDEVWGYVFNANPTSAQLATIHPDAVRGTLFPQVNGLDFKFTHTDGNELGHTLHSASPGTQNWAVVWVKRGGAIERTWVTNFKGVTSLQTNCQLSGGSFSQIAAPSFRKGGCSQVAIDEAAWKAMIQCGGTVRAEVPGA